MKALLLAPFDANVLLDLGRDVDVVYESWLETQRIWDPDELGSRLSGDNFSILVIESDFIFEETFEQAANLRFLGICRADTKHIDIEAATRHGVLVINTPGRNARGVAEHAVALMFALARRIPQADKYIREGKWGNPAESYISMRGVELGGRTLGIIGMGAIGRKLAPIAQAIGMTVLAYDPYVKAFPQGVSRSDLETLATESDFISIHVPVTAETEGLVDARFITMMKPTSIIVDLSDSAIVSHDAIVPALQAHRIAGAAFDVFDSLPLTPGNPLLTLDNVILTPHLGGATDETITRHSNMMAGDIRRFLAGVRPEHLVNPEAWKTNS